MGRCPVAVAFRGISPTEKHSPSSHYKDLHSTAREADKVIQGNLPSDRLSGECLILYYRATLCMLSFGISASEACSKVEAFRRRGHQRSVSPHVSSNMAVEGLIMTQLYCRSLFI